jgi:hypothetical protein
MRSESQHDRKSADTFRAGDQPRPTTHSDISRDRDRRAECSGDWLCGSVQRASCCRAMNGDRLRHQPPVRAAAARRSHSESWIRRRYGDDQGEELRRGYEGSVRHCGCPCGNAALSVSVNSYRADGLGSRNGPSSCCGRRFCQRRIVQLPGCATVSRHSFSGQAARMPARAPTDPGARSRTVPAASLVGVRSATLDVQIDEAADFFALLRRVADMHNCASLVAARVQPLESTRSGSMGFSPDEKRSSSCISSPRRLTSVLTTLIGRDVRNRAERLADQSSGLVAPRLALVAQAPTPSAGWPGVHGRHVDARYRHRHFGHVRNSRPKRQTALERRCHSRLTCRLLRPHVSDPAVPTPIAATSVRISSVYTRSAVKIAQHSETRTPVLGG